MGNCTVRVTLGMRGRPRPLDADTRHFAHALEDLPEEARQQAAEIAQTQPGVSLRRRILDEVDAIALDSYGTFEQAPLLHFLSRYPVTPYTYQVSGHVSRGQRPDAQKLADLASWQQCPVTINLCAATDEGHIQVTDMESPTVEQVTEILDLLSGPGAEPTYVHCEAGKGRTGVAIACYRMAVAGWSAADALTEAVNFGCIVPGQQAFISTFGAMLQAGPVARRYPLLPSGSVSATPAELAATIRTAAGSPEPNISAK